MLAFLLLIIAALHCLVNASLYDRVELNQNQIRS